LYKQTHANLLQNNVQKLHDLNFCYICIEMQIAFDT